MSLLGVTMLRQHRVREFLDLAAADADVAEQAIIEPLQLANDRRPMPLIDQPAQEVVEEMESSGSSASCRSRRRATTTGSREDVGHA
ncbi:MAG TPA: hypothetical protein VFE11_06345 [Dongiaceae bacterium]|nr:hypothetical protein [Dongiaceae bacterium]